MSLKKNKHFPILGFQEFIADQLTIKDQLLFNELHGERHIDTPHQHDFFIMILFNSAKGIHNIDFVDYNIQNSQIHLLFPGQVHKWNIQPDTTGYQLMIDRDFFERFSSNFRFSLITYRNHPVFQLDENAFNLIYHEFLAIKNELESKDSLNELIVSRIAVIASIISKVADNIFTNQEIYKTEPRIERFQQMIDKSFKEKKLVSLYASDLNISANYLNILCKKHLNISATQLIQQRIVLEARRLLKSTGLSIKEVAFELGYIDHAYFSNFFKTQTGISPTDFRNQL
ncbi:helix-turn-helix domain-containing protein [Gelidibacter sp.]|uniref:AraC family transcriptional regulator n=1 Tax=Gelidibacter sp. TaxID=2018083 RepID=UPI003267E388